MYPDLLLKQDWISVILIAAGGGTVISLQPSPTFDVERSTEMVVLLVKLLTKGKLVRHSAFLITD